MSTKRGIPHPHNFLFASCKEENVKYGRYNSPCASPRKSLCHLRLVAMCCALIHLTSTFCSALFPHATQQFLCESTITKMHTAKSHFVGNCRSGSSKWIVAISAILQKLTSQRYGKQKAISGKRYALRMENRVEHESDIDKKLQVCVAMFESVWAEFIFCYYCYSSQTKTNSYFSNAT